MTLLFVLYPLSTYLVDTYLYFNSGSSHEQKQRVSKAMNKTHTHTLKKKTYTHSMRKFIKLCSTSEGDRNRSISSKDASKQANKHTSSFSSVFALAKWVYTWPIMIERLNLVYECCRGQRLTTIFATHIDVTLNEGHTCSKIQREKKMMRRHINKKK